MRMLQKFVSIMAYKLDLRKSVANFSGRMSSSQILQMFKDRRISPANNLIIMRKKTVLAYWMKHSIYTEERHPPNGPQARPIEDFWSVLNRKIYEKGREAQNEQQLIGRIKQKLKEIDPLLCQRMILKVPYLLRKIEDNGPLSVIWICFLIVYE